MKKIIKFLLFFLFFPLSINPVQAVLSSPRDHINGAIYQIQPSGNPNIVVAVIDSGVYINHPDLKNILWRNFLDAPGDNIDNDGNGFIDDYYGWNFVDDNANMTTKSSHGTEVAGIIGASGNLSGIASGVKIMPIIVCGYSGCKTNDVIAGIQYAIDMGADIINLSLGATGSLGYRDDYDSIIKQAYDKGIVIVVAAGNGDTEGGLGQNLDLIKASPVCNEGENNSMLGVGALDLSGNMPSWSAYGSKVDLFAPGEDIISTSVTAYNDINFDYYYNSGTSFAAPIVSGVAALIKSKYPTIKNYEIYDRLISSRDKDKKLDAYKAISATSNDILKPKIVSLSAKSSETGRTIKLQGEHLNNSITLTFIGPEIIKTLRGNDIKILNSNTAEIAITSDFKDGLYSIKISVGSFEYGTLDNALTIKNVAIIPETKTETTKENKIVNNNIDLALSKRLNGKLLLQVEQGGRIWYVDFKANRYEVTFANALTLFQKLALGINNTNLNKIPLNTENRTTVTGNQLKGKLLLQTEDRGRIWYVDQNGKRWEVTWANLMELFKKLSLGIKDADLNKIQEGSLE